MCEKCISDEPSLEDVPADHEAVVRAAQVLLQHNVEDENVIIPSMVFAALAAESPIFKKIANECAEGWLDDAQRKTLELNFSNPRNSLVYRAFTSCQPVKFETPM